MSKNNWNRDLTWVGELTGYNPFTYYPNDFDKFSMKYKSNSDGSMTVSMDIPGVKSEDMTIEAVDKMITVKGERKTDTTVVKLSKSFNIPEGFSADNVTAELVDGVLSIKFLERLPSKIKNIPIISLIKQDNNV